jgi:hypothetical protein
VSEEPTPLDLLPPAVVRRRAAGVAVLTLLISAAVGGLVGLVASPGAGLVAAALVGVPLLLLALTEARRRSGLDGSVVAVRALGTRRVDVDAAGRRDLLVSHVRGQRTVSLLLAQRHGKAVTVALAIYTAAGGVELGVLPLRKLADALALAALRRGDDAAATLSELLVAQLRAEARGEPLSQWPLWLVSGLVEAGRVVRQVPRQRLAALVAELA